MSVTEFINLGIKFNAVVIAEFIYESDTVSITELANPSTVPLSVSKGGDRSSYQIY